MCDVGKQLEAASVTLKLNDDEKKFENCVELGVDQKATTMTLTSRMCRTMNKFFICQLNGMHSNLNLTHAVDKHFSSATAKRFFHPFFFGTFSPSRIFYTSVSSSVFFLSF